MMNFNQLLGIKYPVIQGGMAHIATGQFAASVSAAGGMGLIASGSHTIDGLREQIHICKSLTQNPFGVNIMLMHPKSADIVQLCIDEKVPFVTTGGGNPEQYIKSFHENNITIYPVVPTLSLAKRMERIGADGVIAEGMEAGGHIGFMTTFTLIPQLAAELKIPIIAAGGIYSGATLLAAEVLGASGVQMGTAFLATEECPAHDNYKDKVLKGKSSQITIIGEQAGFPTRLFQNAMTRKYTEAEKAGADAMELELFTLGALSRAVKEGDVTDGSVMAGLVAGSIHEKTTVPALLEKIMAEYQEAKSNLSN